MGGDGAGPPEREGETKRSVSPQADLWLMVPMRPPCCTVPWSWARSPLFPTPGQIRETFPTCLPWRGYCVFKDRKRHHCDVTLT